MSASTEILSLIPHRPPFLFVDEIVSATPKGLVARRTFRADEEFYKGHYPGAPITPGVLLCEAVFQTAGLYMARKAHAAGLKPGEGVPLIAKISEVRFRSPVYPGDTIQIEVTEKEAMGGFTMLSGVMTNQGKRVLTLDFSVAWKVPEKMKTTGEVAVPAPMSDFLNLAGKTILVFGVANRRSVAWITVRELEAQGAKVVLSVRSETRRASLAALVGDRPVFVCDVEQEGAVQRLAGEIQAAGHAPLQGLVHSIAFANYRDGFRPFLETGRADFLQATAISAFSLVEIARAFRPILARNGSIVTIGISSLQVTPDNYGYMGPIKAALESASRFVAKSLSADSEIRCNVVGAGPLKTSASAGIPGYAESYLYAEKLTFRKRNLATEEVANTVLFLLSERSSGINGATLVVDAGLGSNFFDQELIRLAMRPELNRPPGGAA